MTIIDEQNLYKLILQSRKPKAEKFKHWITHEALPEIRRAGIYTAPNKTNVDEKFTTDELLTMKKYGEVAQNAMYGVMRLNSLLSPAIHRCYRLQRLLSLSCPDIITTNETRMARERIEAIQLLLDGIDDDLRKLQLATDHRTSEERLLEAVFADNLNEMKGNLS